MAGVRHSTQAFLSVYGELDHLFYSVIIHSAFNTVPPFVVKTPDNASLEAGEEAVFSCVVGGDPSPRIRWIKQDGKLNYVQKEEEDAAILRIKNVTEGDAGKYLCHAENIAGQISSEVFLTIKVAPMFIIRPQDKMVRVGDDVLMQCKIDPMQEAILLWQVSWTSKSFLPGTKERNLSVDKMGNLHIGMWSKLRFEYNWQQSVITPASTTRFLITSPRLSTARG